MKVARKKIHERKDHDRNSCCHQNLLFSLPRSRVVARMCLSVQPRTHYSASSASSYGHVSWIVLLGQSLQEAGVWFSILSFSFHGISQMLPRLQVCKSYGIGELPEVGNLGHWITKRRKLFTAQKCSFWYCLNMKYNIGISLNVMGVY